MLGLAAADLLEQVRIFARRHRSTEHSEEAAVELPRAFVEVPADGAVVWLVRTGRCAAGAGGGVTTGGPFSWRAPPGRPVGCCSAASLLLRGRGYVECADA